MDLKETLLVSLINYAENLQILVPFIVPTLFMTGFIYITGVETGVAFELKMLVRWETLISALRDITFPLELRMLLLYLSTYLLFLLFSVGVTIGYIKEEIEGVSSLEKATRVAYKSFLPFVLLLIFYALLAYLTISLLPGKYAHITIFAFTFFFLYTLPSIVLDENNFIPAFLESVRRVTEIPFRSFVVYMSSLFLLILSVVIVFYELLYFPLMMMFVLPLVANIITLSYLREEEEEVQCPECGGVLEAYDDRFVCTECGAEYVYE